MKFIKILLSVVAVIVIVAGLGLWLLFSNLNGIVKEAVETVGSDTLETSVGLNNVDIQLTKGSGELNGFTIANLPGFKQEKLLSVDTVKLDIDPTSLNGDVIVIDELTIQGVKVIAEQLGETTNLQALLDKFSGGESDSAASESSEAGPDILLAVKQLNFVENSLTLATEKYGEHTLDLPNIVQSNIGSASNGLTPNQLAQAIAKPLIESAKKSVEKGVAKLAEDRLKEKADEEKERLKEKVDEKLGEGASEKLKNLKDLF